MLGRRPEPPGIFEGEDDSADDLDAEEDGVILAAQPRHALQNDRRHVHDDHQDQEEMNSVDEGIVHAAAFEEFVEPAPRRV